MSAVLTFPGSITSTAVGDAAHVEAAIRLLENVRAEGERRAQAFGALMTQADAIHSSIGLGELETNLDDVIDKLQRDILGAMVRIACDRFAPAGGALSIDLDDYKEKHLPRWDREERRAKFDPRRVWADLVADWGQGQGEVEGYKQAAAAIIRFFHIRHGKEMQSIRGNVVLPVSIWIDDFDKKWSNRNRMSSSSRSNFDPIAKHFDTFAAWSGLESFALAYRNLLGSWGYSTDVTPRERFPLGEHASLTTYLKKVEFHFSPVFMTQLTLFLQTFGNLEEP